jgi:hypothetical protein
MNSRCIICRVPDSTIRPLFGAREGGDGSLDLVGVADTERAQLHTQ